MKAYAYSTKRNDLATNQHTLWSRRCDYFDQVITEMMHNKLRKTFDPKVWEDVLANTEEDFDAERRSLTTQKTTVTQKMQTIVTNFSYAHTPSLLQALEQDYLNYEQEQVRLQNKLAVLERRVQRHEALIQLAHQAENVLANWHQMNLKDQRIVAHAFIVRIVVTPTGKHRAADIEIQWRDESTNTFVLPYRADKWTLWTPEEVERLIERLERHSNAGYGWHCVDVRARWSPIGLGIVPKPVLCICGSRFHETMPAVAHSATNGRPIAMSSTINGIDRSTKTRVKPIISNAGSTPYASV